MANTPSIARALDHIEQVADGMVTDPKNTDITAATRAANRIVLSLKASDAPSDVIADAKEPCDGIRGATIFATGKPDRYESAAGDMQHRVNALRELLGMERDS